MSSALKRTLRSLCSAALLVASIHSVQAGELDQSVRFDIRAQSLEGALLELSRQSSLQIVFSSRAFPDRKTPSVSGTMSVKQALDILLAGTDLAYKMAGERTLTVVPGVAATPAKGDSATQSTDVSSRHGYGDRPSSPFSADGIRLAQSDRQDSTRSGDDSFADSKAGREDAAVAIPEVLVEGSKSLNMDIQRTRDGAQPHVVFEREQIQQSGATNLNEFLKQRLTMNTQGQSLNQIGSAGGNTSSINLRGLGTDETLILIDGHRAASAVATSGPQQADINGIPLSAVERIEVLPTTASGIYGGSATGGVVNIVLRRDYTGVELGVTYKNTFDTGALTRAVDLSAGLSLEGGKTSVLIAGTYSDASSLALGDRDFVQQRRLRVQANNSAFFLPPASPPLGATPNIRSANGSPLFGTGTPAFTSVSPGYAGGGGLAPLLANAGQYNLGLAPTTQGGGASGALLTEPSLKSFTATIRREFTPAVQAFIDAGISRNEGLFAGTSNFLLNNPTFTVLASAPNNPFGQNISVTVPHTAFDNEELATEYETLRIVGGLIVGLPHEWKGGVDYTWSTVDYSSVQATAPTTAATTAISNGTIDVLRDTIAFPIDLAPYMQQPTRASQRSTLKDAALRAAGPIGVLLPGGRPMLSGLIEYREELIGEGVSDNGTTVTLYPSRSQSVRSAYLEATVPLVSATNSVPLIRELEVQAAIRRDEYDVNGASESVPQGSASAVTRLSAQVGSTNPTFAVRYRPVSDLTLRASYGTGFLPPSVSQLIPLPFGNTAFGAGSDPRRGSTPTPIFSTRTGGNPNLEPEDSRSWSAGLVYVPAALPGFRLSIDYTRIEKTNNIATLTVQQYLDNESLFPDRIIRGPVPPGDAYDVGPVVSIDRSFVNLSRAKIATYDLALDYRSEGNRAGVFDFFALATWQPHFITQIAPSTAHVENVGVTSGSPLKFKANAGLVWELRAWKLGWTARYFDSYLVAANPATTGATTVRNQGALEVRSQLYHDIFAAYRFDAGSSSSRSWSGRLLEGVEVRAGVENVFNEEPPFDASNTRSFYSFYGDPRQATYYLSIKKAL